MLNLFLYVGNVKDKFFVNLYDLEIMSRFFDFIYIYGSYILY